MDEVLSQWEKDLSTWTFYHWKGKVVYWAFFWSKIDNKYQFLIFFVSEIEFYPRHIFLSHVCHSDIFLNMIKTPLYQKGITCCRLDKILPPPCIIFLVQSNLVKY